MFSRAYNWYRSSNVFFYSLACGYKFPTLSTGYIMFNFAEKKKICSFIILLDKITSSSQQKCLKSRTEKLEGFSWAWLLQALRAEEGLDERLAVGIGITLRRDEAGEDGRTGDEGRNVSGKGKEISMLF